MKATETFRAREVYRYYQPRNIAEPRSKSEPSPLRKDREPTSHAFSKQNNFNTQQAFSDTALTAFAQLIALRLSAQRAIVSLIDHENEYFLAESTSTLSFVDGDSPAQNAWLSISGARVPRQGSLCEQTLQLVPNQETTAGMTPMCFVPDLLLDEKMSRLDCVEGPPYLRFYCGVALTNKSGVNIGCVYVVDDRPRSEFTLEQAQFLTTMTATVMDHLENIRAKEDIVRVTRMSQALHAFIEGDGTMDGDWQRLKKYNLPAGAGVGFHWETTKDDGAGSYFNGKKELGSSLTVPTIGVVESPMRQAQSPLQHTGCSPDSQFNFKKSPWSSSSNVPILNSVFEGIDNATAALNGSRKTEFSNNTFSNLLRTTFSRASNLVREGMEVDGAVFFDAPFKFYQGRSTLETDPRRLNDECSESSAESEDEDHLDVRPGPRPHALPMRHPHTDRSHTYHPEARAVPSAGATLGLKSEVLGYSTAEASSWNNQSMGPNTDFTAIDQSLLTSLVRHYPQGELFVFDQDGPISSSAEIISPEGSHITIIAAVSDRRARHNARKLAEIQRLLVAFPGARQIFFVPLYDSISGCFIGSFAWSTSATRVFSVENHLSYLIAFGHSVMSEVSRLNALSADRAKGDFINNVSHELRSPLHGILASVEFLADTALDGFQRNLVDTVDICGRTLLDTIEHILDFSKIKKFGQESAQPMGVVADLDISAVIEEVLEGVFAGFEFNGLSSEGLADTTKSLKRNLPRSTAKKMLTPDEIQSGLRNDLVTVVLDVDFRDQWKFPTVPGTWRRLTMNLFGNSLKYTRDGYIIVKLEARSVSGLKPNINEAGRTMVTLTVSDSGKGMSSEFMEKKLFMPFSQEDATAPGTGLGMSMVKQIVDLSGGQVNIRSEIGKGTVVKLSLPLEDGIRTSGYSPVRPDLIDTYEDPVMAVRRRAKGRTVTLRGFDNKFRSSKLQLAAADLLKASVEKYITEWFHLAVVCTDGVADILISDESHFLNSTKNSGSTFRLLLILCSNGARRDLYTSQLESGQTVEFISKPCGPHRLAKGLLNVLDTEEALEELKDRSSIGFSPTAIDLKIPPDPYIESELNPDGKPSLAHRRSSGVAVRLSEDELLSPESSNASTRASKTSSTSVTSDTSPSRIEAVPSANVPCDTTVTSRRPKMLLVEDNPVNMMLLSTYMNKNCWEYEMATNGLIALQAFQSRPQGFDVIFMDVSMPIMTGYESTCAIRAVESERRQAYDIEQRICRSSISSPILSPPAPQYNSFPFHAPTPTSPFSTSSSALDQHLDAPELAKITPALIIALTGFSSQRDQEMAVEAGVDVFMTKPVRFKEVGRILEGWMKSREMELDEKVNRGNE